MHDKERTSEIVVEGKSFVARHTHINDTNLLFKWFERPDFVYYKPQSDPAEIQPESIQQRIFARNQLSPRLEIELLLIDRISHIPFGLAELTAIDRTNQKAEFSIGYIYKKGTRSMVEVLYCLFERIFLEMQLRKLIFHVSEQNTPVLSLLNKYDFTREGKFKDELLLGENWVNIHRFCLFKEQWENSSLRTKFQNIIRTIK